MGLEAAWRAGHALNEDPDVLDTWEARSEELRLAIIDQFWDEEHQTFSAGVLGCYLFWPYPLLPLQDPRMQAEAHSVLDWCLSNLRKETTGGGYEPLGLWMLAEQAKGLGREITDRIEEAILLFAHEVRTEGTLHFGEAYVTADLDGDGTLEFEAHAAQPQIPIASMVYLTAVALYGPDPDGQTESEGMGSTGGCGACSLPGDEGASPSAGWGWLIIVILVVVYEQALRMACHGYPKGR